MRYILTTILTLLLIYTLNGQNELVSEPFGGHYEVQKTQCVSHSQRNEILEELKNNVASLKSQGVISSKKSLVATRFDWPLRQAEGFDFNGYYGISNFVDHNPAFPNHLLDYNCGERTYDIEEGYNHRGTDIFTWPLGWKMVDNNQVEVIAAAPGIIIGKSDGNADRNCEFSDLDWNAVYVFHDDGMITWYGHMKNGSLTDKGLGATVESGEYLGIVASSGSSTGPHLHFEVWEDESYTKLIDPWQGDCNLLNEDSFWKDQQPYYSSTLNHAFTNKSPIKFNLCPIPTETYEATDFKQGERVYITTFYRDQREGQVTQFKVLTPDGLIYSEWEHTSPSNYNASYWYFFVDFDGTEPLGEWTYEVAYGEDNFIYTFNKTVETNVNEVLIENHLTVYPNPTTNGMLVIEKGQNLSIDEIAVFNHLGQKVYIDTFEMGTKETLDLSHLDKGAYLLSFKSKGRNVQYQKVILL